MEVKHVCESCRASFYRHKNLQLPAVKNCCTRTQRCAITADGDQGARLLQTSDPGVKAFSGWQGGSGELSLARPSRCP